MRSQEDIGSAPAPMRMSSQLSRQAWVNFLKLVLPLGLVALLYLSSARVLASYWNDTDSLTYTHGWIVLLVTLWLLFDAATSIGSLTLRGSWVGAAGVALISVIWLLAHQTNIQIVQLLSLPALCWFGLQGLYGSKVAKQCAFALGYLYFAVPFWGDFNSVLQWGTVFAERAAVRIVGIPAYFDANTIHLPSGVIAVEGGCSGLHFFIVGLALATLYGYVNRINKKWRLLALAGSLAILANWVRVFVILVAGYLTNMQHYLVRVEHYRFGWAVFAVMMMAFFVLAHRMPQAPEPVHKQQPQGRASYACLAALALVSLSIPLYARSLEQRSIANAKAIDIAPPPGWRQNENSGGQWHPIFMRADAEALKSFSKSDVTFDVYHAMYATQTQDKKVAAYDNTPIGELHGAQVIATQKADGPFTLAELSDALGDRQLIWYAYYVDDRWFSSALRAQTWSGLKAIVAQPLTGVVVLHANCAKSCDSFKEAFAEWTTADQLRRLNRD